MMRHFLVITCSISLMNCASPPKVAEYKLSHLDANNLAKIPFIYGENVESASFKFVKPIRKKIYTGVVAPVYFKNDLAINKKYILHSKGEKYEPILSRFSSNRDAKFTDPNKKTKNTFMIVGALFLLVLIIFVLAEGKTIKVKSPLKKLPTVKVKFPKLPKIHPAKFKGSFPEFNGNLHMNFNNNVASAKPQNYENYAIQSAHTCGLNDLSRRNVTNESQKSPIGYVFLIFKRVDDDCMYLEYIGDRSSSSSP